MPFLQAPTEVVFATDEWFAICSNLNNAEPPQFDPNAFDSEGTA
jgi:allantoicase